MQEGGLEVRLSSVRFMRGEEVYERYDGAAEVLEYFRHG